uniref:Uncharacterized protein n=1 Tax=Anopheles farauti TaxID=69004 RepID=A0A182Q434_9DIPT
MNLGEKYEKDIPKRLQNELIFADKVAISRHTSVVYVITQDLRLLEVRERAIFSHVSLAGAAVEPAEQRMMINNSRLFNDTPYEVDSSVAVMDCTTIVPLHKELTIFRANDGTKRKLFLLVQLDRTLVVVERRAGDGCDGNGSLHVHTRFEEFRQLSFVENVLRAGSCAVQIEVDDREEPIVTDFLDTSFRRSSLPSLEDNFTGFDEVLKTLHDQTAERKAQLEMFRLTVGEVFNEMNERMKTVPALLRSSNVEEKIPLVRYGEVWKKVHNDQLLIGVPLYNGTYKSISIAKQLEIEPIVVVEPPDLCRVQFGEELEQHVVGVGALAGVLPLRFDHTVQPADRDQIVLVLLERLELRYHIVMEEAGRAEVRHRHPVHVDLVVRVFDLVQQTVLGALFLQPLDPMLHAPLHVLHVQPVLAVDRAVRLKRTLVLLVLVLQLQLMGVLSMLHQPQMVHRPIGRVNRRPELQQLLARRSIAGDRSVLSEGEEEIIKQDYERMSKGKETQSNHIVPLTRCSASFSAEALRPEVYFLLRPKENTRAKMKAHGMENQMRQTYVGTRG